MTYINLVFTDEEMALIAQVVDKSISWSSDDFQTIRVKIRNFFRALQGDKCCYCRKSFEDDHPLAVDVEHVLPKSKFPTLVVTPLNLAVACKRCNLTVKKGKYDFVFGLDDDALLLAHAASGAYEIVHPNLDDYYEHISVAAVRIDESEFKHYLVKNGSQKAMKTIEFFRLRDLEVANLDAVQGIEAAHESAALVVIKEALGV